MRKLLLLLSTSLLLIAAEPLSLGTGKDGGNYFAMGNDIKSYCSSIADIQVTQSGGSIDNLAGMTNKKFQIGIVQTDVLMSMAKNQPRDVNQQNLKVIAGLHSETIHLLIPNDYKPKADGFFARWKSSPVITSINDLKNIEVASTGGSLVSAAALNEFFNLNWSITPSSDLSKATTPVLLVGGAPYAPVEDLLKSGRFKLVPIPYESVRTQQPFYLRSVVTYTVNSQPMSVETIGVQAMLVGKAYRSADRNLVMEKLATCIDKAVPDMADDSKTNPNWVNVYENQKQGALVNWSFFNTK